MNHGDPSTAPALGAELLLALTGAATIAAGALLLGAGTAAVSTLALGTAGQVLVAGASAPTWTDTFTTPKTITRSTAGVDNLFALRNSSAAVNAATQFILGNDAAAAVGYFFATSSTYTGGFGGAASMNFGSSGNVGILAGNIMRASILSTGEMALGGSLATAGNGLLQCVTGTTRANGVTLGDTFFFRAGAGTVWLTAETATLPAALGAFNVSGSIALQALAAAPNLYFQRTNGTRASPTAPTAGQGLGNFLCGGYNGSAYKSDAAQFSFGAAEDWTGSATGTNFTVLLTALGSTAINSTYTLYCTVPSAGQARVGINTSGAPGYTLDVNGDIRIASGSVLRVNATQVVGAQGAAVADASGGATVDAEARTAINNLLARLRAHGLIAT